MNRNEKFIYNLENAEVLFGLPPEKAAKKLNISIKEVKERKNYIKNKKPELYNQVANIYEETYAVEVKFLKDEIYGLEEKVCNIFKRHLSKKLVNKYIENVAKTIREENLFSNIYFITSLEERVLSMIETNIISDNIPTTVIKIPEKVEVPKEVIKKVPVYCNKEENISNIIYTDTRIAKEFPEYFKSEIQVKNCVMLHAQQLLPYYIQYKNGIILTDYGVLKLVELVEQDKKDFPLPDD